MTVNGKPFPFQAGMTVQSLLLRLGLDPARVAAERDGRIVPRARFADEALCETDKLELVQFVGGG